jgi:hypothetical protein
LRSYEINQKYLGSFEMWCCGRIEISWTDRVTNEEVLQRVKEERNILRTVNRRKANWIGHILCRNCLRKHVIEGKIEGRMDVTGRRGRKCKRLLDALNGNRSSPLKVHKVPQLYSSFNLGARCGWVINATPRPLYLWESPCAAGWVSPRAGLDECGKSLPPPVFDTRTVQPVGSRYSD